MNFHDLFSTYDHSRDFNSSRAEYIHSRLRPLSLILALLMLLWIPLDFAMVSYEQFISLLFLRISSSVLFLLLFLWNCHPYSLTRARVRLALLVLIPEMFYLSVKILLGHDLESGLLVGYTFFPYILVAMPAVFPLTFSEGIGLALPILGASVAWAFFADTLHTIPVWSEWWLLSVLISVAIWAELAQLHMLLQLYRQATRDALTGLFNRRVLIESLRTQIAQARRYRKPISVIIMDLDRFKRVNDTYGHLTGDAVLQKFALMLECAVRDSDIIGRYGGEEFFAILPNTPLEGAQQVAERIRHDCEALHHQYGPENITLDFTVSAGVGELNITEEMDDLLMRVDEALYIAKGEGRNCVIVAKLP